MGYKRLDYLNLCKIQALWKARYSQQKIADERSVHKSTISRELNRNITFVRTQLGYRDYKARIGDWEIDTIIGKNHKQVMVSIVKRVSKLTILRKVESKKAIIVSKAIIEALKPLSNSVLSITSDGNEFAGHQDIATQLNTDFFFAHPYSSWERSLNENTNWLVRQYLKKGCGFSSVCNKQLLKIEDKLNNRPRKTLGYATPNERFTAGV